jgi:uncharacterized protein YndB with AHSA1/START domain
MEAAGPDPRWGCQGATHVESKVNSQTGGGFLHTMTVEGCGVVSSSGTFDEIVEAEKIVWRSDFGGSATRVTVEFKDQGEHE